MDLSVQKLSLGYGERRVLTDAYAQFRPGRITAILGPNGAGKSSLVKAMAGLLAPASGSVRLNGQEIATLDPRERARAIGYLPQDGTVHWNVAVEDVVALGRLPHRSPFTGLAPADLDAINLAMAATETQGFAGRRITELSGGERARVLLARVLAGEPRWLLADEPLASLDPAHQLDILARLRDVADGGTGVVIVLHDLVQAARAADDVLLLKDGRVIAFGPPPEVLTAERLREAFEVEILLARDASGRMLPVPVGRSAPSEKD